MYPILLSIGGFDVHSHDALIVLGGLLSLIVFAREARPVGVTRRDIFVSIPLLLAVTFLCVYLSAVWLRALTVGWIDFNTNFAYGTSSFGMVLGVLLTGYLVARWRGFPPGVVLDRVALVLPLAQAVGRIGCFLEGCCYGLETDGFLGMYLPGRAGEWATRYPTQLMLAAFNLGLFALLWSIAKHPRRRSPPTAKRPRSGVYGKVPAEDPRRGKGAGTQDKVRYDGGLTLLYLFSFSLGRLLIDALRDLPRVLGPFSPHQLTSLVVLVITAYIALELRLARSGR